MLARQFRRSGLPIPVAVGGNRYRAGSRLVADQATPSPESQDVLVLDDGFQHLQLQRDLDIVLIDATCPLGTESVLPFGRLREPLSALGRAGVIVLTRTEPGRSYDTLERKLRILNAKAPILHASTEVVCAVAAEDGKELSLADLAKHKVAAFCGLGNAESFWRTLRQAELIPIERARFPDHHRYSASDVQHLVERAAAAGAESLLTTEKDLMNLADLAGAADVSAPGFEATVAKHFRMPLYWLKVRAAVRQREELLQLVETALGPRSEMVARPSLARQVSAQP
jgi:tetraacyldisaccharide 4'-kinase